MAATGLATAVGLSLPTLVNAAFAEANKAEHQRLSFAA